VEYKEPIIEIDGNDNLIRLVIGTCDSCEQEIDNSKEPFIKDNGKIYHANNKCYKG